MRHSFLASKFATLGLILILCACQTSPPQESGAFRPAELVELVSLDSSLHPDIRYATAHNFTGHPLYTQARAFLQRPAAEALVRAHRALQTQGLGIVIYDAYRPWSVTKQLWDSASPAEREAGFVADPKTGSKHNRGCAVDIGLYDLKTGQEIAMPSGYDEFSERAYPHYAGGSPAARQARDTLRLAMEAQGFTVADNEWWHFNYRDWRTYPVLDVSFEELQLDTLLDLMRQRLILMHEVARWKWNTGKPIADPEREQALLDDIAQKAQAQGLPGTQVRQFFAAQIAAGKQIQSADFQKWRSEQQGKFPDVRELAAVRSDIDALNLQLLAALAKFSPPPVASLRQRAEQHLMGAGIDNTVRDQAVNALLEFSHTP